MAANLPGHCPGHQAHGGTASRGQIASDPHSVSCMVRKLLSVKFLSLVGLLQHATKVVKPERTFILRMYSKAAKLKELHYYTNLTKNFRSDLCWWHIFVNSWNSISFFKSIHPQATAEYHMATDASGSWRCGGCFNEVWFQYAWPTGWSSVSVMVKELVPIILSGAVWAPLLRYSSI